MTFDNAQIIDSIYWTMRLAEYPRSSNRSDIDKLANGWPPYTAAEAEENGLSVNFNSLDLAIKAHEARAGFASAFLKPGNYFKCSTDHGPRHKRAKYGNVVTTEINRIMKRSMLYTETFRSKFAMLVLHGISPAGFRDDYCWCPEPFAIDDTLVPARTLLTMQNMPLFIVRRSFTGPELIKLTQGPKVDPGWNMDLVNSCLKWIDQESVRLMGSNWPEVWSPEKYQERIKSSGGFYTSDNVPTIDCVDFYYWSDDDKQSGWRRRMILDAWSTPTGASSEMQRKSGGPYDDKEKFLYNPGERVFADKREQIINWQFADLSAVAPFWYHSVRSLGFLLYATCHLQNRLRCRFNEAVFEQLMIYFQVNNKDDAQRALEVELGNRKFIDPSISFIKAGDRYQVNSNLVELGLAQNSDIINRNAQSNITSRQDQGRSRELPTATQWMGEEQKVTQLVSSGLAQAYLYQIPEYREILRRFFRKNSQDPDVNRFQAACLRQGVPDSLFNAECWDLEPERIMGAGNKSLEMAIAQQLMQYRNLYDPEPQRDILRDFTLAVTDDAARADAYVPEAPHVSDTVHDTELVFAALMQGTQVTPKSGVNNIEVIGVMLKQMGARVQMIMQSDGVGTPQDVQGLALCAKYAGAFIQKLAEDPNEKPKVKEAGDALGKIMNEVKGMAQRQEEQRQKQAQANGDDAETQAKIKAMLITAQAKAENTQQSHAQRTAQRQLQWEMEQKQKEEEFQTELQRDTGDAKVGHEMALSTAETSQDMRLKEQQAQHDRMIAEHDLSIKKRESEHALALKKQEHDHKLELQKKESEHKMAIENKMSKSKPKPAK